VPPSRWRRRAKAVGEPPQKPTGPGPHHRSDELARLEAALFLAREPLSTRRLAKLAGLTDGTRARALLRELKRFQEESGAAVRVEQIAGGFRLLTRAALGPWVRRLLGTPPENRLSAAALETLAIVAYRQPVTRAEMEAIRGVGCEDMLRQLMERDFVAIGGRTEDLGRPNVYVTSRRFLQAFGLARIEDLPRIESLVSPQQAAEPPADPTGSPPA
jgi:segregation and condensation protein B